MNEIITLFIQGKYENICARLRALPKEGEFIPPLGFRLLHNKKYVANIYQSI